MSDMIKVEDLLAPAQPDSNRPWPDSPPKEGDVYSFSCPATGAQMVAMTRETFLGYGTMMEEMRRSATQLEGRCKELHAAHTELARKYNDLARRHEGLREATRKERIAHFDQRIVTAPANSLPTKG